MGLKCKTRLWNLCVWACLIDIFELTSQLLNSQRYHVNGLNTIIQSWLNVASILEVGHNQQINIQRNVELKLLLGLGLTLKRSWT